MKKSVRNKGIISPCSTRELFNYFCTMISSLTDFQSPFFIGIAGTGMSALAQYLQGTGMQVSGSTMKHRHLEGCSHLYKQLPRWSCGHASSGEKLMQGHA